jgi:hypothetical protein
MDEHETRLDSTHSDKDGDAGGKSEETNVDEVFAVKVGALQGPKSDLAKEHGTSDEMALRTKRVVRTCMHPLRTPLRQAESAGAWERDSVRATHDDGEGEVPGSTLEETWRHQRRVAHVDLPECESDERHKTEHNRQDDV